MFEFEIELASKPTSNVIPLDMDTSGYRFFKQEKEYPVTEELYVPPNVEGGYVIYLEDLSEQIGIIYRPEVVDADGNTAFCELNIPVEDSTEDWGGGKVFTGDLGVYNGNDVELIVPQKFLDNAVYPILIDPHIGWNGIGTSYANIGDTIRGNLIIHASGVSAGELYTPAWQASYGVWLAGSSFSWGLYRFGNTLVTQTASGVLGATINPGWLIKNYSPNAEIRIIEPGYATGLICSWGTSGVYTLLRYSSTGGYVLGFYKSRVYSGVYPDPLGAIVGNNHVYSAYSELYFIPEVDVSDQVDVTEDIDRRMSDYDLSVTTNITITESTSFVLTPLLLSVTSDITITESLTAELKPRFFQRIYQPAHNLKNKAPYTPTKSYRKKKGLYS